MSVIAECAGKGKVTCSDDGWTTIAVEVPKKDGSMMWVSKQVETCTLLELMKNELVEN